MKASSCLLGTVAGILILFCAGEGAAQELSLSGTVRDVDGVVPDATVTLLGGGAAPRVSTTDNMGRYSFDRLAAGYYELSFAREGYDTITRTLTVGEDTGPVDVVFAVGGISTSITVIDVAGKATASRLEIPDRDLPVQVSSIPQQLLQQQGINDMANALRNASGVQAQRLYGVYEQYTIRGFNAADVMLVDGMRTEAIFNRFNTQLNNVESVEVLKGPSSVLYGGDAVGGAINIIRKKPQGTRAYDFMYKGGRFNSHQVAAGATGPLTGYRWLYRADASYDYSDGWRGAGANRLNVSPSLTFLISESARVTVHQSLTRDDFKGDGGVAVGFINSNFFDPSRRFSLPDDFALIEDSQTHVLLNANISPSLEFRNGFLMRRTSEEYFVTEGVYFDPRTNTVPREGLYFHHHRRPYVNQAELVGRVNFGNMRHTVLLGYDFRHFYTRTDVTEDGGFYEFTPISVTDFRETNPSITSFPIVRETYQTNRIHAAFWQDQIDIGNKVKINIGGRFDDFDRDRYRLFLSDPSTRAGIQTRNQTSYTYRAGIVVAPVITQQIYFSTNSSFSPVIDVPADGSELEPRYGRGYEAGYRLQALDDRIRTSIAFYHIEQNNMTFSEGLISVVQAGKQASKGLDLDVNADLGDGTRLVLNYGYTVPRFDDFEVDGTVYTGNLPRFAQKHAANAWLHKSWASGFTAAIGARYVGSMFTNNENTVRIGGWAIMSGSIGYRRNFWEWTLNAENLLNRERYFTPSDYTNQVYPGAPINVFASIRLRFQ
jgi:iron complex outermembrane receptor protein